MNRGPLFAWAITAIAFGCGTASPADTAEQAQGTRRAEPSSRSPQPSSAIVLHPELDAARAWALSARPGATIERVVEAPVRPPRAEFRVIARDGDVVLDARIDPTRERNAHAYWRVAELVDFVRRIGIDQLQRDEGWALLATDAGTMVCGAAAGAACIALPTPMAVSFFFCEARSRCTLHAEYADDRVEEWMLEPERGRRRLMASWPARAAVLDGPWERHIERRRWEALDAAARPAWLDDARLALPNVSQDGEIVGDGCRPTVRSVRRGDNVVRVVSCGEGDSWSTQRWPAALVLTQAGRTETTPLRSWEPGTPAPLRIVPLNELAPNVVAFSAQTSDGGSPSGCWTEDLWAVVPDSGRAGPVEHQLDLAVSCSDGLGNHDDGEGYVVAIDRRRWTFEVTGSGLARYTQCERWSGTHARRSDRWRGERQTERLELAITFHPDRGFEMSDADRAVLHTRCGAE